MQDAPYYAEIARNPNAKAHWIKTTDGLRLRAACWSVPDARGTVLLLPGRTEYIEKYGPAADDLCQRGYSVACIDWRGQGLGERLLENRSIGHVGQFADYQHDVRALIEYAETKSLPRPYHIFAHSMGGCIALRSAMEGVDVQSVAFSAPMWGIKMSPMLRPFAWGVGHLSQSLGLGEGYAPGQGDATYVSTAEFEGNTLTSDPEMYALLQEQHRAEPDLCLGGPSTHWLIEALKEMRMLSKRPAPTLPCATFLGTDEDIVDSQRIHDRMANWQNGTLHVLEDARHEIMMERPAIRTFAFDRAVQLFDSVAD